MAALIILSPIIGSFLGVLITRMPTGEDWVRGRSRCDACGARIPARHLIPLFSYVVLRGRAACCGAPLAWFHPGVELASLGIALLAAALLPEPATAWLGAVLGWSLLTLAWIDARCFILPDVLTLPLLLLGLGQVLWLDAPAVTAHALAVAVAYLSFRLIAALYRKLRGRDGLGQGDAKLLAAGAAWVGPDGLSQVVLLASLLGIGLALLLAAWQRNRLVAAHPLPFGPALAIAIWAVWLSAPPGQALIAVP